jgi:hypothetical protein
MGITRDPYAIYRRNIPRPRGKKLKNFFEAAGARNYDSGFAATLTGCSTLKANVYAVKIFFMVSQDVSPLLSSGKYHNVKVWWAALTTSFLEAI